MFHITAIYAGLVGLFYTYVSLNVSLGRNKLKVSVGDGGSDEMSKRIRAHGNFAEYAPITLILIAMTEAQGAPASVIHGAGLVLLATRAANFIGMTTSTGYRLRYYGAILTYLLLLILSVAVLGHAVF
ncbi:MAPEG family protein [Celeribacter marinus]|uniref:MAPEG family protein n=1 Tax=Celeribacter marinus TaxID=1397108 RepID=UPI003F6BCB60